MKQFDRIWLTLLSRGSLSLSYSLDRGWIEFPSSTCAMIPLKADPQWDTASAEIKTPLLWKPRAIKGSLFSNLHQECIALRTMLWLLPGL